MNICSLVPAGNGATIIHQQLQQGIDGYSLHAYNPALEYAPFAVPFIAAYHTRAADIIHATPDNALFCAKAAAPLVVTVHNYVLDDVMRPYNSVLQRIHYATDLRLFTAISLRKADQIICVSRFIADLIDRHYGKHASSRIIYNGIDHTRFLPARRPAGNATFRVLFSGNLTRRKGAHWLPAIARQLNSDIEIHYTAGLRNYADITTADNLVAVGRVPHDRMPDLYPQFDLLLAPTVREGFGLGIAEAMSCGLPVVATDCSAVPELVENEKGGMLCPPGDCAAFAHAINALAASPSRCREMGAFNRHRVETEFSLNRMLCEYNDVFETALSARS
jgi:L-malate glycosyltransferase